MPFYKIKKYNINKYNINKLNSLRVRMHCRKKALFSASMTVEAALSLSFFLFAMLILMVPLKMINTHRILQAELESIGEDLSKYAYVQFSINSDDSNGAGNNEAQISEALRLFNEISSELYIVTCLKKATEDMGVEHISAIWSDILTDGENINLNVNYDIIIPFSVFGISSIRQTIRCHRRAWIGKSIENNEGYNEDTYMDEEMVYIGKNSTRYHKNQSCHYLSNKLICVAYNELSKYRNGGGAKYTACAACKDDISLEAGAYIFEQGKHYHSSPNCPAITSYIQKVPLSQVEYLGACSYCGQ